ncbi:MAG TPA: DUF2807 domain-containing protein [Allosphingosinicella sp.]|jgi:hypothetical protein|uniref:GIN domain-containing protein n=1 Tax=Allosphingosinicella sp. TaxID=2823234 RepID=UPI002F2985EF
MRRILALAALAIFPSQGAAAETVPVAGFQSVQLRGGGEVVVRHGPAQRVTIIEGSSAVTRFEVKGGGNRQLVISVCEDRCPRNYRLKVEIVTPTLAGMAIEGGGRMAAAGSFPQQPSLGLAIRGGGTIDARTVAAASVGAAVNGGGLINTHALRRLGAAINGGGAIRYWGDPAISTAINGGGAVTRGGAGTR